MRGPYARTSFKGHPVCQRASRTVPVGSGARLIRVRHVVGRPTWGEDDMASRRRIKREGRFSPLSVTSCPVEACGRRVGPSRPDEDRGALGHDLEELLHVLVQEPHAAVRGRLADALGLPGPVEPVGGLGRGLGPA